MSPPEGSPNAQSGSCALPKALPMLEAAHLMGLCIAHDTRLSMILLDESI